VKLEFLADTSIYFIPAKVRGRKIVMPKLAENF